MPNETVTIAVSFKLALILAFILTVLSAGASILLAIYATPNDSVKGLIETFSTTWEIGCGAFFGLLGGRPCRSLLSARFFLC